MHLLHFALNPSVALPYLVVFTKLGCIFGENGLAINVRDPFQCHFPVVESRIGLQDQLRKEFALLRRAETQERNWDVHSTTKEFHVRCETCLHIIRYLEHLQGRMEIIGMQRDCDEALRCITEVTRRDVSRIEPHATVFEDQGNQLIDLPCVVVTEFWKTRKAALGHVQVVTVATFCE